MIQSLKADSFTGVLLMDSISDSSHISQEFTSVLPGSETSVVHSFPACSLYLRFTREFLGHNILARSALYSGSIDRSSILHLIKCISKRVPYYDTTVGSYAMCVIDRSKEQIVLSRDILGHESLFYCMTPDLFSFSNNILNILRCSFTNPSPDYKFIREYIINQTYGFRTRYKHIRRVLPGEVIIYKMSDHSVERFDSKPDRSYFMSTGIDGVSRIRRELTSAARAARDSMPKHKRLAVQISGGIDSTSLASLLCSLRGESYKDRVVFYSVVYNNAYPSEEPYIRSFERMYNVRVRRILYEHIRPSVDIYSQRVSRVIFYHPFYVLHHNAIQIIRSCGVDYIATGLGGDKITGATFYKRKYHHMLSNIRFSSIIKELIHAYNHRWLASAIYNIFIHGLWPILSHYLKPVHRIIYPLRGDKILRPSVNSYRETSRCQRSIRDLIWESVTSSNETIDSYNGLAHLSDVKMLHPYLSINLLSAFLSARVDRLFTPGEPKHLVKKSLRNVIPKSLYKRKTKSGYDQIFLDQIFENRDYLISLCKRPEFGEDYIDHASISSFLKKADKDSSLSMLNRVWDWARVAVWMDRNHWV